MKFRLSLCIAFSVLCVASMKSAAAVPGELLLSIPSPDSLHSGFGHGLSVSGNEIAIGAYSSGVVFRYDASGNRLASYDSGTDAFSGFGKDLAYDGDRIIAGGPFYDTDILENAGRASVIDTTSGQLLQTNIGSSAESYYGWATAISQDFYAVSAMGRDTVFVYDRQTNAQSYVLSLTPGRWSFGVSLAAEGNQLVVGAPRQPNGTKEEAGAVYLYDAASQNLSRTLTSPNVNDINFGWSVAVRNSRVLVGAPYGESGGTAYLFDAGSNALLQTFHNPSPAPHSRFGWSVAFSGDNVVVGAPGDGSAAHIGSAYAFQILSGSLLATLSDPAPEPGGQFGWAVAGLDGMAVVSGHCNSAHRSMGDVYYYAVPEPSAFALLSIGAIGLVACAWRRKWNNALQSAVSKGLTSSALDANLRGRVALNANCSLRRIVSESLATECVTLRSCLG